MDWFRSWHGAPTDDKWIVIAKRSETQVYAVSAFVWALLDHASKNEARGQVSDFDFETYSAKSGMDEDTAKRIYNALEKFPTGKEIIKEGQLVNWEKRQPKREDNSTGRVRKHRNETQRNADETQCNAPEKIQIRLEEIREEKKEEIFLHQISNPEIVGAPPEGVADPQKPKSEKKGTRLPPEWTLPDEWGDWAMQYCASKGLFDGKPFVIEQGVVFKNYWTAKTSQATKLDWKGTWENWIRRGLPDYQLKIKRMEREKSYEQIRRK